jgi:SAM-dependent methyltransferase
MTDSSLYDEYYYSHNCGRPYKRDESWLSFFDQIAKRLIEQSEPKTVLDAGCAWGFLVEGFRNRGVDAFGIDISEYAIQNVYPAIREYCRVGSITEPFPSRYDLITCIEVLEHMPQAEAEKALENLCAHTDEVIFSSTPFDYKEATHFNVHDPEYWAEQFARHGFYRDLESDLSYITSWAVRFVRRKTTNLQLVRDYERKFWQYKKENFDLRQLSLDLQNSLKYEGAQNWKLNSQMQELNSTLTEIHASRAWKLIQWLWRIRLKLIPHGSRLEQILRPKNK